MIEVDATRKTVNLKGETETLLGEFGNAMYYFLDTIASSNKKYVKWAYRDLVVVLVKAAVLIEKKYDIKLEVGALDEEDEEEEEEGELLEAMTEALSKTPPDKLRSIIKSMFEDDENRKEKK